jgi:hypothetical protein
LNAFVFDVESIGLYGDGFAVAWTVQNSDGREFEHGVLVAPTALARGANFDREWVVENVLPHLQDPNCADLATLRVRFWEKLQEWKAHGATIFAECLAPVEALFLAACVAEVSPTDPAAAWKGPYPFHDVASVMLAAGMDPLATYERRADELPAHHPLADARLSARLLREAGAILSEQYLRASSI